MRQFVSFPPSSSKRSFEAPGFLSQNSVKKSILQKSAGSILVMFSVQNSLERRVGMRRGQSDKNTRYRHKESDCRRNTKKESAKHH